MGISGGAHHGPCQPVPWMIVHQSGKARAATVMPTAPVASRSIHVASRTGWAPWRLGSWFGDRPSTGGRAPRTFGRWATTTALAAANQRIKASWKAPVRLDQGCAGGCCGTATAKAIAADAPATASSVAAHDLQRCSTRFAVSKASSLRLVGATDGAQRRIQARCAQTSAIGERSARSWSFAPAGESQRRNRLVAVTMAAKARITTDTSGAFNRSRSQPSGPFRAATMTAAATTTNPMAMAPPVRRSRLARSAERKITRSPPVRCSARPVRSVDVIAHHHGARWVACHALRWMTDQGVST
jgi:hypothetical protein